MHIDTFKINKPIDNHMTKISLAIHKATDVATLLTNQQFKTFNLSTG